MKAAIYLIAIIGLVYYMTNYHSPFQTEVTDPYYVEVRIEYFQSDVQLVGVGKMNSYEDCQTRALLFWVDSLKNLGEVKVGSSCRKDLPKKFMKLFDNQVANASYIVFDKGTDGERDGRFLIYGVPSSIAYDQCQKIAVKAKKTYSGKVYCIQGTVG